jgi:predicted lipoprotein with Yx(FWY)xxD motif
MTKTLAAIGAALLSLAAAGAFAQMPEPAKVADTSKGKALVDAKGMTLYILDRDNTVGKSSCNGQCATNWPPFMAAADAHEMGSWTVITRDDGSKQWAYKGKPLYGWHDDKKPGDVDGDGRANNVWHIAAP